MFGTQQVTYAEEKSQYSFTLVMDFTETSLAKYYFDPDIAESERQFCIETTDLILSTQTQNTIPEIYIFSEERYDQKYINNGKLYLPVQNWKTVEYTTDVLLAIYGEFSHYGLVYGYANWLCGEHKLCDVLKGSFTEPMVVDALDLNLLCFDPVFISEQDVVKVKGLASDFVRKYIANNGNDSFLQLLTISDTAEGIDSLVLALADYYHSNGTSYKPSLIRYAYGGVTFDYIVDSDVATCYLKDDWSDINCISNPLVYEGFLHTNYCDVKSFFETNFKQMQQYQDLFSLEGYKNDLSVVFANDSGASIYSYYQGGTHTIYVRNVDSFMHEYIHALTQPTNAMSSWEVEGFARYYSYKFDHYGIAYLNQDYNNVQYLPATKYVYEYLERINRPIDIALDYAELENIAVYSRSYDNPNSTYVAGSSFVQYLVSLYGDATVIQSIYGKGAVFDQSYEQLVKNWQDYIASTYGAYSKYKGET